MGFDLDLDFGLDLFPGQQSLDLDAIQDNSALPSLEAQFQSSHTRVMHRVKGLNGPSTVLNPAQPNPTPTPRWERRLSANCIQQQLLEIEPRANAFHNDSSSSSLSSCSFCSCFGCNACDCDCGCGCGGGCDCLTFVMVPSCWLPSPGEATFPFPSVFFSSHNMMIDRLVR